MPDRPLWAKSRHQAEKRLSPPLTAAGSLLESVIDSRPENIIVGFGKGVLHMSKLTGGQLAKIGIGIFVFAVLMSLRYEVEGMWLRALIAGCAGVALAWPLISSLKQVDKK